MHQLILLVLVVYGVIATIAARVNEHLKWSDLTFFQKIFRVTGVATCVTGGVIIIAAIGAMIWHFTVAGHS